MIAALQKFTKSEASGGIVLILASALALICANLPGINHLYEHFLHFRVTIQLGGHGINMGFSHFVNDALMAIFFFGVAIEIKHELMHGHLSSFKEASFPLIGAIGGVTVPALIFLFFNYSHPNVVSGWAIPTATDIAFALGVLSLLGNLVPTSIRVFLLALAVIDDLMAIIIIAIFYTSKIDVTWLSIGLGAVVIMFGLNRLRVRQITPYLLFFVIAWYAFLSSGVHATIAGVLAGFAIPNTDIRGRNLAHELEKYIAPNTKWFIIPLFAFVNAGVPFAGLDKGLADNVSLIFGIMLGLVIGKPVGIFLFTFISSKLGFTRKPETMPWDTAFFVGIICGIGFTMSIFITNLSFPGTDPQSVESVAVARLSILATSLIASVVGLILTRMSLNRHKAIKQAKKKAKNFQRIQRKIQQRVANAKGTGEDLEQGKDQAAPQAGTASARASSSQAAAGAPKAAKPKAPQQPKAKAKK